MNVSVKVKTKQQQERKTKIQSDPHTIKLFYFDLSNLYSKRKDMTLLLYNNLTVTHTCLHVI